MKRPRPSGSVDACSHLPLIHGCVLVPFFFKRKLQCPKNMKHRIFEKSWIMVKKTKTVSLFTLRVSAAYYIWMLATYGAHWCQLTGWFCWLDAYGRHPEGWISLLDRDTNYRFAERAKIQEAFGKWAPGATRRWCWEIMLVNQHLRDSWSCHRNHHIIWYDII